MPTRPKLSRAEAKVQTRFTIRTTAIRLFNERGFATVTTQQIADEAGVTQRTLFRHFPSKDAILFGNDSIVDSFDAMLGRHLAEQEVKEAVRLTLRELATTYDDHRDLFRASHRIIRQSDLLQAFERQRHGRIDDLLALALDGHAAFSAREGPASLPSKLAAATAMGLLRAITVAWLSEDLDETMVVCADRSWPTIEKILYLFAGTLSACSH